jgi:hypothetical protein
MVQGNTGNSLKIFLKYGKLEASLEGNYSEVWKFSNDFLKSIRQNFDSKSTNAIISTKNKSVADILIDLRNSSFFDEPKSSPDCFKKFKELGKTGITPNAISMALQKLAQKAELKRYEDSNKLGKYVYIAPYIS